jgi:nitrite reductase/ring-hydroxylating ferredoxin subunit
MIPLEMAGRTATPDGRPPSEQPAWRQDFPIDAPQDRYVARRDFTRVLMLTSVAFGVGQLCIGVRNWLRGRPGLLPPQPIVAVEDMPVGAVRPFPYPDAGEPCLLLRPDERTFVAFRQKCTHLGCALTPDAEGRRLRCPCHNGLFDAATGRPLAGPPRRPLPRVALELRDGVVYAVGGDETRI